MIPGLPVTEERDAKQCFARKGGTARHSPFAHLCEGRFLRVGNEQCQDFQTREEPDGHRIIERPHTEVPI